MSSAVRHMSVSVCAGSISTTGIPQAFSSTRNASAAASSANFDAEYGPSIGVAIRPFTLEMNTHPAPRFPQPRQHRLGHRELPDDVDLQLLSPVVGSHRLDRARDGDARVVHHRVEALRQRLGQLRDIIGVGDVEDDGGHPLRVGLVIAVASCSLRTPAITSQPEDARWSTIALPIPRAAPVTRTDGIAVTLVVGRRGTRPEQEDDGGGRHESGRQGDHRGDGEPRHRRPDHRARAHRQHDREAQFLAPPVPPASLLSTPMPTIVDVSTVVLSSWMPNWRAVAFWLPKAIASPAIRMSFVLSW